MCWRPATLLKTGWRTGVSCEFYKIFKGYLRYKSISCHKVARDV